LKWVTVVPEERVKKKINLRILLEEDIMFWQLTQLILNLVVNKKVFDRSNLEFVR